MVLKVTIVVLLFFTIQVSVSGRVCRQKIPKKAFKQRYGANLIPETSNIRQSAAICSPIQKTPSIRRSPENSQNCPYLNNNSKLFTNNTIRSGCNSPNNRNPFQFKCKNKEHCNCIKQQPCAVSSSDSLRIPSYFSQTKFPEVEYPLTATELWMPNFWEYNCDFVPQTNCNETPCKLYTSQPDSKTTYKPANKGIENAIQALLDYQNKIKLAELTADIDNTIPETTLINNTLIDNITTTNTVLKEGLTGKTDASSSNRTPENKLSQNTNIIDILIEEATSSIIPTDVELLPIIDITNLNDVAKDESGKLTQVTSNGGIILIVPMNETQDLISVANTSTPNNKVTDDKIINTTIDEILMETTMSPLDIYEDLSKSMPYTNDQSFFKPIEDNSNLLAPEDEAEFITLF